MKLGQLIEYTRSFKTLLSGTFIVRMPRFSYLSRVDFCLPKIFTITKRKGKYVSLKLPIINLCATLGMCDRMCDFIEIKAVI